VWWNTSVIPALGKLRKKECEFVTSLGYIMRLCIRKTKNI
jgi:hypothetical protein